MGRVFRALCGSNSRSGVFPECLIVSLLYYCWRFLWCMKLVFFIGTGVVILVGVMPVFICKQFSMDRRQDFWFTALISSSFSFYFLRGLGFAFNFMDLSSGLDLQNGELIFMYCKQWCDSALMSYWVMEMIEAPSRGGNARAGLFLPGPTHSCSFLPSLERLPA